MKTGIIDEIKSRVSCADYMRTEHGANIVGGRCRSFRADATNPSSLLVNDRDWYDFGSGIGGDVIDLAAEDKFSGNIGRAISYLAEKWGIEKEKTNVEHVEVIFNSYREILEKACRFYEDALWRPEHEHCVQYLRGRGLTDETIRALRIGWADNPCAYLQEQGFTMEQISDSGLLSFVNRVMIPYLRNGKPVYMLGRASVWPAFVSSNPDAKYMKLFRHEMSEHPIWGLETLRTRAGTVIVAEGIFDAISCWQEGYPVVTAVTGISVSACYLTGDDAKKDISMLYALSPTRNTLENIFLKAEKWEKLLVKQITNEDSEDERKKKFVAFMKKAVRIFDWPDMAELFDIAKGTGQFNKAWLMELAKQLKRPPTEREVMETFVSENDVIYHPALGFYQYENSTWHPLSEYDVRNTILDLCGKNITARLMDSSIALIKAKIRTNVVFDYEGRLLNFPNGMVNIETGERLEHAREYYSLRQMSYCYDPEADCPEWLSFLETVTNGDESKQNLLQEMFGYCLTRDVRYQTCFCLIGEGANGKSVLLKVLEAVVGHENTSHIEIAFLNQDFQRIKLFGSLVNICNDMHTDVSGTESYLKAIVSGDPINGCKKYKDFVDFSPYCKMVFSANRMPTAREIDAALIRRFCFITFPVKFVDNPKAENERQKVDNIADMLLAELPGILNWAMRGLKCLREQGKFSEPADEKQSKEELYRLNNPIISFVEEVVGNGGSHWQARLSRKEVYKAYNDWCQETNTKPLSARGFWPRLREVFPMEEFHSFDGWYVCFTDPYKYCGEKRGDRGR